MSAEPIEAIVKATGRHIAAYYDKETKSYIVIGTNERFSPEELEIRGECSVFSSISPQHYDMKIEPIDFISQNELGFCEGNVIKYVSRHKKKNGAEDIRKAIRYLEYILHFQYNK